MVTMRTFSKEDVIVILAGLLLMIVAAFFIRGVLALVCRKGRRRICVCSPAVLSMIGGPPLAVICLLAGVAVGIADFHSSHSYLILVISLMLAILFFWPILLPLPFLLAMYVILSFGEGKTVISGRGVWACLGLTPK
jgi:hypothetical protein